MKKVHYSFFVCKYAEAYLRRHGRPAYETHEVVDVTCRMCKSILYRAQRDSKFMKGYDKSHWKNKHDDRIILADTTW